MEKLREPTTTQSSNYTRLYDRYTSARPAVSPGVQLLAFTAFVLIFGGVATAVLGWLLT